MNNDVIPPGQSLAPVAGRDIAQRAAIRRSQETSAEFVPYLGLAEVQELAHAAERTGEGKKAERDKLLIETLFDGCFRVSEALGIRTSDMVQTDAGWQ